MHPDSRVSKKYHEIQVPFLWGQNILSKAKPFFQVRLLCGFKKAENQIFVCKQNRTF
jgi:hypothetical protein